jgi:hypothetical protein
MQASLPEEFAALEPFVAAWALDTQDARHAKRLATSRADIKTFYDAMVPRIPRILEVVDAYPLGTLPPELQPLFALSLSLAEIAPHVELYRGDPGVPHAFEETRFVAKHGRQATWKAEPPN